MVIDHNEYAVIREGGKVQKFAAPELAATDYRENPAVKHMLLRAAVTNPRQVVQLGKALQIKGGHATLVLMSGELTNLIVDVPTSMLQLGDKASINRMKAVMRRMARESGSGHHRFMILPEGANIASFAALVTDGVVTDVVSADGRSLREQGTPYYGDFLNENIPVKRVAEAASPYGPRQWTMRDRSAAGPVFGGDGIVLDPVRTIPAETDFDDGGMAEHGLMGHAAWVDPGNTVYEFAIFDDGRKAGVLVAEVAGQDVVAIHDFEVYNKRKGVGRRVVDMIAGSSPEDVRVIEALDQSAGFWKEVGANETDQYGNTTIPKRSQQGPRPDARRGAGAQDFAGSEGDGRINVQDATEEEVALLRAAGYAAQRTNTPKPAKGLTQAEFRDALIDRFGQDGIASLERQGLLNFASSPAKGVSAWYEDGKAYFDPSWHASGRDAIASVLHEVGTHHGIEAMLGKAGWRALKGQIVSLAREGGYVRAVWDGVVAKYPEFESLKGKAPSMYLITDGLMHEIVAKVGETAAGRKSSIWRDILAAVNRFLLKMGVARQINQDELADLVQGSLKRVMAGKPGFSSVGGRQDAMNEDAFRRTERAYGGREAYNKAKAAGKTKLNYRQWVQVRTPEFKAWFGDWEAQTANSDFNRMLGQVELGEVKSGTVLQLGVAGPVLGRFGIPPLKIEVTQSILRDHMQKHGISFAHLRNIAEHVQAPIAVFKSKTNPNSTILLTEIQHPEGSLVVAIHANKARGSLVINDIRSIHPKPADKLNFWVEDGLLQGVDEDRGRHLLLTADRANSGREEFQEASSPILYSTDAIRNVSKVTDPDTGEPMVVYHGTPHDIADGVFRRGADGIFFTDSIGMANRYADTADGGNVVPVYLSIQNPAPAAAQKQHGFSNARLDAAGYNGIIEVMNRGATDQRTVYIAFKPTQIKSATANNGDFDGTDPNITARRPFNVADFMQSSRTVEPAFAEGMTDQQKQALRKVGDPREKHVGRLNPRPL